MNITQKDIIVYVNSVPPSAVSAVRKLEKLKEAKYRIMLLRDSRVKKRSNPDHDKAADIILDCDFSKPVSIANSLVGYQKFLLAISCRSESNIARFMQVIPHVPYLRTPSTESLMWATDKYEMRKRLRIFDPKHTPKFTVIKSNAKDERKRVIEKVGFPMIVKPTNLAASALVSICYHEEELEKTLRSSFRKLRAKYQSDNRIEVPKLMAEQYMEGVMYSVDSYVGTRGVVHHCPLVKVTTGKNIGHDDFYNYLRETPVTLKKESMDKAFERVELAIHALSLRNTTTHTELLYVDGDWKIIEVGPRIGGHRHVLHELSCDIDHSLNDLLIRIPNKPVIPKKCKGFAAVMRYYADQEGLVAQITGLKKIQELKSFKTIDQKTRVGDRAYFAKNGGGGIFDLTLYHEDHSKLQADVRRVEQMVEVKVKARGQAQKAAAAQKLTEKIPVKAVATKAKKQ